MKRTDLSRLGREDMIKAIGKEWMLITAGVPEHYNTMTASWGGVGFLWGKPVAFIFVRPERYTHEFIEASDLFTLSFFGAEHRDILTYCGAHSGRDGDKAQATGLVAVKTELGSVGFAQSRLTLECRKAFRTQFAADEFIDKEALRRWYNAEPGGSLHTLYIGEIINVYE